MMNDVLYITLQIGLPLKEKLESLARLERRTPEDQALCLIENTLRLFESRTGNVSGQA